HRTDFWKKLEEGVQTNEEDLFDVLGCGAGYGAAPQNTFSVGLSQKISQIFQNFTKLLTL
ncbi:MAG: hypothetical protein JW892_09820, partial [Anaerolineae bacterium]|nr:hypothetical protein [Anaerolineae bacterium]